MKRLFLAGAVACALLAGASATEATISSPTVQVVDLGNGSTTVFNYSFLIPYQADGVTPAVQVQTLDSSGNLVVLASNQYSISGVGNASGGSVTYNPGTPLPAGWSLIITRALNYVQPIAVANYSFYPHTVEVTSDNLAAQIQQLAQGLSQTIQFPPGDQSGYQLPYAENRENTVLGFGPSGAPVLLPQSPAPSNVLPLNNQAPTIPVSAVTFYGADNTGVNYSTAAFAAIFADTSNPNVYFPPGTYKIACGHEWQAASAIHIAGAGPTTVWQFDHGCLFTSDVFEWLNVQGGVENLTINENTPTVGSLVGIVSFRAHAGDISGDYARNLRIINGVTEEFQISAESENSSALRQLDISGNYLQMTKAGTQNQCIGLSTDNGSGAITSWSVRNNTCVGSAIQLDGNHGILAGNDVSAFGFGSAYFFAFDTGSVLTDYDNIVIQNLAHNTTAGTDINSTAQGGFELTCIECLIVGNIAEHLGGAGFINFGDRAVFEGNYAFDNGVNGPAAGGLLDTAGFALNFAGTALDGNNLGTIFGANYAFDDQGSPTQLYGFAAGSNGTGNTVTLAPTGSYLGPTANVFQATPATLFTTLQAGTNAVIYLGGPDVATPSAQIFQSQSVVTGTSNTPGTNFTISGSRGTGNAAGGQVTMSVAPAGSSGSTQNVGVTDFFNLPDTHVYLGATAVPPTCGTGCASIAGNSSDERMTITSGSAVTSVAILFGKTWSLPPVCNVAGSVAAHNYAITTVSTGGATVGISSAESGTPLYLTCH